MINDTATHNMPGDWVVHNTVNHNISGDRIVNDTVTYLVTGWLMTLLPTGDWR